MTGVEAAEILKIPTSTFYYKFGKGKNNEKQRASKLAENKVSEMQQNIRLENFRGYENS